MECFVASCERADGSRRQTYQRKDKFETRMCAEDGYLVNVSAARAEDMRQVYGNVCWYQVIEPKFDPS